MQSIMCVTEYVHDSVMCVCHKAPDEVQLITSLYDLCNENSLCVYVRWYAHDSVVRTLKRI